jgi:hypothetical protein
VSACNAYVISHLPIDVSFTSRGVGILYTLDRYSSFPLNNILKNMDLKIWHELCFVCIKSKAHSAWMQRGEVRMFKTVKLAAAISAGLLLASGAASATQVPAGTLNVAVTGTPVVDNTGGTIVFGVGDFYFNGQGGFGGYFGTSTLSGMTLTFSKTVGAVLDYTSGSIPAFFTFTGGGDTYSFAIDQSIQTVSYTYDGSANGTIGLYILGDLTATGATPFTTPTPTAFTLTLNETGGSGYSASGTLANPPPGSGVTPVTPVPEPASMTILGGGLAALSLIRRRRARK